MCTVSFKHQTIKKKKKNKLVTEKKKLENLLNKSVPTDEKTVRLEQFIMVNGYLLTTKEHNESESQTYCPIFNPTG